MITEDKPAPRGDPLGNGIKLRRISANTTPQRFGVRRYCAALGEQKDLYPNRYFTIRVAMSQASMPWPHAPTHELSSVGTYFVTAGTYLKSHHFRSRSSLDRLHFELLRAAREFGWELEAWAVFSNHYHFIGRSPSASDSAKNLTQMIAALHRRTAKSQEELAESCIRKTWHNYWDTKLTYHKSYLARLNYVHQNAVRHGLVQVANQYPWCSARWFERTAAPATVQMIYRFKTDGVAVHDQFVPIVDYDPKAAQ